MYKRQAQHWDAHPISEEEKQQVIRLALDEDKMTLIFRELRIGSNVDDSSDPPIESTYVPKAEDVREIASFEGNPVILMAAVSYTHLRSSTSTEWSSMIT